MAEIDKQKEVVANYRLLLAISLTSLMGIIAFIFNYFDKVNLLKQLLLTFGRVLVLISTLVLGWLLKKETDKLKDL